MTDDQHPTSAEAEAAAFGLEPDDLDGHTIEELSDYLDAGRLPANPSIDESPGCQIALAALAHLQSISAALLEEEAALEPPPEEHWIGSILQSIGRESRAGRSIPLAHPDPAAALVITEGAVRGLVRAAGDDISGLVIGQCRLDGDVTVFGAPITVSIEVNAYHGVPIIAATERLRAAVLAELARHTELVIVAVDITVTDLQHGEAPAPDRGTGERGTA